MKISSRIRRVTVIAVSLLALGVGGFSAAPAHADTAIPAGTLSLDNPDTIIVGSPYWTETTPGVEAYAIPDDDCTPACLQMWNISPTGALQASALNVKWYVNDVLQVSEKLVIQTDGNFVFYVSNGKVWAPSPTVRPDGEYVAFQPDGNLVVRNRAGAALWASNTHTYPHAFLAVQSDGNLVIYESPTDLHALWDTGTES
jgi:hypothetical protein